MSCKVSVIIPVYNVEPFIERCARSLFEQTLDSIEYIFVDDCSPDLSIKILQNVIVDYPNRKNQIQIIHQPHNMGVAKAREAGLKIASGEYIIHCDSDDWVDRDMYKMMYQKAKKENLDMIICDWYNINGMYTNIVQQNLDINDKKKIMSGFLNYSIKGCLWNKLIASYIYKNSQLTIPSAHMMEDLCYSLQLFYHCKNFGYIPQPLYHYNNNPNSISHCQNLDIQRCHQATNNINTILDFLKKENLTNYFQTEIVSLKNGARVFLWPLLMQNPRKYYRLWYSIYPEINWQYPFSKGINLRLKLIFILTDLGIYPYIHKTINRKNKN